MSRRQYGRPFVLSVDSSTVSVPQPLQRISFLENTDYRFNEGWLRDVVFDCPELIPVREIESAYSPLIPVCRELPTAAGPLDALYVNPDGMLTVVECKLWRNPEARREVVGQILDYAKELSRWSYEDLQAAVAKSTRTKGNVLFDIAKEAGGEISEPDFVDNISRNLKRGRFLLLILGDGIRESVENITNFLQEHSGLHFTFSLVEMAVFGFPEGANYRYLFQPRILARTEVIERAVITINGGAATVEAPQGEVVTHKQIGRRIRLSDEEFFAALSAVDPKIAQRLPAFFERCREIGLEPERGNVSMILRWQSNDFEKINYNFGTFFSNGTVNTNYICWNAYEAGDVAIGEKYLEGLARLLGGYEVSRDGKYWSWRVCKGKKLPGISELLDVQDQWLVLIEETMQAFQQLKHS